MGATLTGIALTAVMGACSGKSGDKGAAAASAPALAVQTVSPEDSELAKTYPATIKGKTDIAIRPQVTGFITKVHVDEGQRVHKGQVLFTLDQVQFQAAVAQAEAAVNSAQTAVNTAAITESNKKMLLDKNIISEYEWQMAANSLAQAKAQLAQAQAGLVNARKNLEYTVVTAPSDGVVGTIPNREGSLASPSSTQPLTTVSDNSEVYAYFSLTEKDILDMSEKYGSLEKGVQALPGVNLLLADGTVYPRSGRVATVSGVIDGSTGAASVRALFENPDGILRSGNTGQVSIPVINKDVILIPQKATFEIQDKKYVYTLNDSNITVSTPVEVQNVNDGKRYVVLSGLKPGDRVVVQGIGTMVREGMPVSPVTDADQKAPEAAAE